MDGYDAVRSSVGGRTLSNRDIISLRGEDSKDFLDRCVSNYIPKPNQHVRAFYLDTNGRVKADMNILNKNGELLVISNKAYTLEEEWSEEIFIEDVEIKKETYNVIDIQGPTSSHLIESFSEKDECIGYFEADRCGDGGYEFISSKDIQLKDIDEFTEKEAEILRVEAGIPSFENELKGNIPLEAGLEMYLSFDKCYPGQEIITRAAQRGNINRKLVGIDFDNVDKKIDRDIILYEGEKIGEITSIVDSPMFGLIGLGYIEESISLGLDVKTEAGFKGCLVSLPFYER